jgi:hypothetical protein
MSSRTVPPRVLILAAVERDRQAIEQQLTREPGMESAEIRPHGRLAPALRWTVREDWIPELVVLVAGYTHAWSEEDFVDLWNAVPLARWIVVHDGWTRSVFRHLAWLPSSCCVPRERFSRRLRQEVAVLRGQGSISPLTASLDESFVRDAELPVEFSLKGLRAGLFTPDRDLRRWLRELLAQFGATIVPLEQKPAAVVWDLDPWDDDRRSQLAIYRRRDRTCRIVGLRNTVHELSTLDAQRNGVDRLVPKQLGGFEILDSLADWKP